MSWGVKFVQKLKIIGYPSSDKLIAKDYDWLFENEELAPFLEWFTESVDASNLISKQEFAEYNKIDPSEIIMDIDALERALNNLPPPSKEMTAENKLEEEVQELACELENAQARLKIKQKQSYKLNDLYTSLNEESNKLSLNVEILNAAVKEKWTDCLEAGKQFDTALNEVQKSNQYLHSLYSGFFMNSSTKNSFFLSQIDLSNFQIQEEKHNILLKTFIKKQFFEGFEKVSADTWNEISYKLKIKKPDLNLVQEQSHNDYLYHCLALKRLCDFYPNIKLAEIDLQAEEYQLIACIDKVKKIAILIENGKFPSDSSLIGRMQKELKNQMTPLKGRLESLRFKTIIKNVNELVDSQTIKTVTGDYALKSVRQQYVNSKLDKVLNYLIRQRARCEMFSLLFELELQNHRETSEVVSAVDKLIEEEHANVEHTLSTLQQLKVVNANFEIQSQDDSCSSIYNLLVPEKHSAKNRMFALLESAKDLQEKLAEVDSTMKQNLKYQEQRAKTIDNLEQSLETITFYDQLVNKLLGQTQHRKPIPITGLPSIEQALMQLRRKVAELETKVFADINQQNAKQKLLKNNEWMRTERKLFQYFYNNPKKLEEINKEFELHLSQPTMLNKD